MRGAGLPQDHSYLRSNQRIIKGWRASTCFEEGMCSSQVGGPSAGGREGTLRTHRSAFLNADNDRDLYIKCEENQKRIQQGQPSPCKLVTLEYILEVLKRLITMLSLFRRWCSSNLAEMPTTQCQDRMKQEP